MAASDNDIPMIPKDGSLRAISLQVELDPIPKESLPVSVVQVLPIGTVEIRDMRENFEVSELSVLSILAHFGGQSVDLAIDYDHGMWDGSNNLAAGWGEKVWAVVPESWFDRISPFIEQYGDRVGLMTSEEESLQGVYVYVRWTEKAAELIRAREYRYVSPVIFFAYTGEANYLWNAAIVNNPAIDGMDALAASAMPPSGSRVNEGDGDSSSADDGSEPNSETLNSSNTVEEGKEGEAEMPNLKNLVEMFGLDVDTEAEDFDAEAFESTFEESVEALKTKANERDEAVERYDALTAEFAEMKENLSEVVSALDEYRQAEETAKAEARTAKIDAAIQAGMLAESQRPWAEENFEAFEELLPTLSDQPQGPPQGKKVDTEKEEETLDLGSKTDRQEEADRIRAYAKEHNLSFRNAFIELGRSTE